MQLDTNVEVASLSGYKKQLSIPTGAILEMSVGWIPAGGKCQVWTSLLTR